jgi:hypothetical protein
LIDPLNGGCFLWGKNFSFQQVNKKQG